MRNKNCEWGEADLAVDEEKNRHERQKIKLITSGYKGWSPLRLDHVKV